MEKNQNWDLKESKNCVKIGILPHVKTRGGQFRIKVFEDSVPIEEYNKVKERCTELETTLKSINKLTNI